MNEVASVAEPLTFRVRDGLVVHRKTVTKHNDGRKTVMTPHTESYGNAFGQPSISLAPAEVKIYSHALEPTDDASAAALEALHFKPPVREVDTALRQRIDTEIFSEVLQALQKAGFTLKAPKAT